MTTAHIIGRILLLRNAESGTRALPGATAEIAEMLGDTVIPGLMAAQLSATRKQADLVGCGSIEAPRVRC